MLIQKEYYICDRCKKEVPKNKLNIQVDGIARYELCNNCNQIYSKYFNEIKALQKQFEQICKKYKFNKYLPKSK